MICSMTVLLKKPAGGSRSAPAGIPTKEDLALRHAVADVQGGGLDIVNHQLIRIAIGLQKKIICG